MRGRRVLEGGLGDTDGKSGVSEMRVREDRVLDEACTGILVISKVQWHISIHFPSPPILPRPIP
jgi:hypothetical protein